MLCFTVFLGFSVPSLISSYYDCRFIISFFFFFNDIIIMDASVAHVKGQVVKWIMTYF